jgi:hypothetical protein
LTAPYKSSIDSVSQNMGRNILSWKRIQALAKNSPDAAAHGKQFC